MITKKNSACIVLLLIASMWLTACNQSVIATIDVIVAAAEVAIPLIPGITATDAATISSYVNAVLSITQDLTVSPTITTAEIATAVADFNKLGTPVLSQNIPPAAANAVKGIGNAIAAFLDKYEVTANNGPAAGKPFSYTLSAKDQAKLHKIHSRILADKVLLMRR